MQPVIKWSGSKRSQAEAIIKRFPPGINTYYEPFCGGASMLARLIESNLEVKHFVCSDLNNDLISLWNMIKSNPAEVSSHYEKLWNELNKDDDKQRKKEYFAEIRSRFNKEKDPLDFMFIMRTTTNGMPRYNKSGGFNNSFHVTRNGIIPQTLDSIINEWSSKLNAKDVQFLSCSYEDVSSNKGDVLYLDPPYANTKGMYYGIIDYTKLWEWIRSQEGSYYLSFDGISGEVDSTYSVPEDIYDTHEYLLNGNSSFKRTLGKSTDSIVRESIYFKTA